MLGSARSPEFRGETAARRRSRTCASAASTRWSSSAATARRPARIALPAGFPVVGVASTIDNDLYGTDITIGVDTALNIALEAIDRLRTTGSSHQRAFLVETMGRDCGYLALMAGIAGGAEAIVTPEVRVEPQEVAERLRAAYRRGKTHALVVVAEGAKHDARSVDAVLRGPPRRRSASACA